MKYKLFKSNTDESVVLVPEPDGDIIIEGVVLNTGFEFAINEYEYSDGLNDYHQIEYNELSKSMKGTLLDYLISYSQSMTEIDIEVIDTLDRLLKCPDLNLDNLEVETIDILGKAFFLLDLVKGKA